MAATDLKPLIRQALSGVVRIRHDLHAHPELAYQERRTSGVVVEELERLGVAHRGGLAGGTGVLAHIPATVAGAEARGAIALRADMDALPIEERTGREYSSTVRGVMHACGHDGHTANLLGVARVLSGVPHRPNPVTLVFQPAEEGGAGGKRMCEDGVLSGAVLGPRVREIYGLHGWPQYEVGVVGSRPGPLLAATDNFVVTVRGTQAHAAYPQLSADPVVAMSQMIVALQTIASRNVAPQDSIVVTIATVSGGTARNIIPERVTFSGTMRTLDPETRVLGKRRFYEIAEGVAGAMGCRAEIAWEEGYPVTFNDEKATARFFRIAEETLGGERVRPVPHPSLGGEDFSYYGHHVPACFFILGVKPRGVKEYPSLHQPEYDFNDDALETGIELMCRLALDEG
ncbi:MAG TPA: M20 family metallopeptidase [Phycisphaerales bacterium]|nr:M20 family metallopeptidase [Phycisphaerales bacterium]